jgi:hypothetical protein
MEMLKELICPLGESEEVSHHMYWMCFSSWESSAWESLIRRQGGRSERNKKMKRMDLGWNPAFVMDFAFPLW